MTGNEVLSDGELDALMETGDNPAPGTTGGYRSFDFGAREQSLLAQFTALSGLQERQAEQLAAALEGVFNSEFQVASGGLRLLSYEELLVSVAEVVAITTVQLTPLPGYCHVICPAPLLSQLVNDYFGGVRGIPLSGPERAAPTPSELRLAERVAEQVVATLVRAWADKLPLEPGTTSTATHTDALATVPGRDKALRLSFIVESGSLSSEVGLILPFAALEPWKARFSPPRKVPGEEASGHEWEPYFRRELPAVRVDVAVMLASQELPLAEILALRVGSVIDLAVPDDVDLCVEGVRLASGRYGSHQGKKAIKITSLAGGSPVPKSTG